MNPSDIYQVTTYLHPRRMGNWKEAFPPSITPDGLEDFVADFGLGEFCNALTIFTPDESRKRWSPAFNQAAIYQGLKEGWWDPGILEMSDVHDCFVVADSVNSDVYLTCPRHGKTIFHLPRHDATIRQVGSSVSSLLDFHARENEIDIPYFDPWPYCSRRAAVGFVARSNLDLAQLDVLFQKQWSLAFAEPSTKLHDDFFQDRFIPEIQARVGLYQQDHQRISVTMTLDRDHVREVEAFARPLAIEEGFDFQPNFGRPCAHSSPA